MENNTQLPNNNNDSNKGQQQSQNQNQHINIYTHGTNVERTNEGIVITPIKKNPFYKSWKFWLMIVIVAVAITLMVFGILYAMDVEIFGEVDTDHGGDPDRDSIEPDFEEPDFDMDDSHDGDHH